MLYESLYDYYKINVDKYRFVHILVSKIYKSLPEIKMIDKGTCVSIPIYDHKTI